jgi:hypothetical protein
MGTGDYEQAKEADLAAGAAVAQLPTWVGKNKAVILVGSWIPYACVEEGRHPYMAPAIEVAMGRVLGVFQQAFREEGLA